MKSAFLKLAPLTLLALTATFEAAVATEPTLKSGTSQNFFNLTSQEQYLDWQHWHHRVGKLLAKRVSKASGKLLGLATVRITVSKDHNLTAELLSASNDALGQQCLAGVRTLDGDQELAFPAQTKRETISFNLQFRKTPWTLPRNLFIKDDFEHVNSDEQPGSSK